MGCCPSRALVPPASLNVSAQQGTADAAAQEQGNAAPDDTETQMCEKLDMRPSRSGVWFVLHRDQLPNVQHDNACEIYEEFLSGHPNGLSAAADFLAVKLSEEQMMEQHDRIRLSSYRWEGIAGLKQSSGNTVHQIPHNYGWLFLCPLWPGPGPVEEEGTEQSENSLKTV